MEAKQPATTTVRIKPGTGGGDRREVYCPLVRAVVFASVCRSCTGNTGCRNRQ